MASPTTPEAALLHHFGYSSFRPFQQGVISATLEGRDSFVLQSTGSGKSLCYQIPAAVARTKDGQRRRPAVVVSPLISLMKDQVRALEQVGIPSVALTGGHDPADWEACLHGRVAVIYITPEKALGWGVSNLPSLLRGVGISLIAVDEAHCVSEWGHDFRPEYRKLLELREALPGVPCMALTATATSRVRGDIAKSLRLRSPVNAIGRFVRPNLTYEVRRKTTLAGDMAALFPPAGAGAPASASPGARAGSSLVYCQTRKDTERVAEHLARSGLRSGAYHAGLDMAARHDVQRRFMMDELDVLVATTAFGMGIDKRDIRLLVHYGVAGSIESYYQQTGRAGRDGEASRCVMVWNDGDFFTQSFLAERSTTGAGADAAKKLLDGMRAYVMSPRCRRAVLLEYFEEHSEPCGECDRCGVDTATNERDVGAAAALTLDAMQASGYRYGAAKYTGILRGTGKLAAGKPSFGLARAFMPGLTTPAARSLFGLLRQCGLAEDVSVNKYTVVVMTPRGTQHLQRAAAWLAWCKRSRTDPSAVAAAAVGRTLGGGTAPAGAAEAAERLRMPAPPELRAVVMPDTLDVLKKTVAASGSSASSSSSRPAAGSDMELVQSRWGASEHALYGALAEWRRVAASAQGVPAFQLFSNRTLTQIAAQRPSTVERLLGVEGVGAVKAQKYGADVLRMVAAACKPAGELEFDQAVAEQPKPAAKASTSAATSSSMRLPSGWSDDERRLHSALRDEVAAAALDRGVTTGELAPDRMLVRMASRRPTTAAFFLSLEGATQERLNAVGERLMRVVRQHASASGMQVNVAAGALSAAAAAPPGSRGAALSPARVRDAVQAASAADAKNSEVECLEAFLGGESVEEIADARGNKPNTVLGNVYRALNKFERGDARNPLAAVWWRFGISDAVYGAVVSAAERIGGTRLGPIKEVLPDSVSYEAIRMSLLREKSGLPASAFGTVAAATAPAVAVAADPAAAPKLPPAAGIKRKRGLPSFLASGRSPLKPTVPPPSGGAVAAENAFNALVSGSATPPAPKRPRPAVTADAVLAAIRAAGGGISTGDLAAQLGGGGGGGDKVAAVVAELAASYSIYSGAGGKWMAL